MKALSLNRQEFSRVINDNCIYVDKTEYVYNLLNSGVAYFLSRPRRFGKSLLVNTFKEIFLGNKELFKNTWIYDKIDWNTSPIIKLDFSGMHYKNVGLKKALDTTLMAIAENYKIDLESETYETKFSELIIALSKKYSPVAILIDEYDKPISDYIDDIPQAEEHRELLKNFYSCLKSLDSYIRFFFITGVSKFSKVSIFSDLNHLTDITIEPQYSALLGYSIEEVLINFDEYLTQIEKSQQIDREELVKRMTKYYDGYSWNGKDFVFNPFSLQRFLLSKVFQNHWFATGTATFLVKKIKNSGRLPEQVSPLIVNEAFFDKFDLSNLDEMSLLFQTGYLTIKNIDYEKQRYTLAFPNTEVEISFLNNLLEVWSSSKQSELGQVLINIEDSIDDGKPEQFIDAFKALFSGIPYDDFIKERAVEAIFSSNVYIALKILGVRQQVELHTNKGRVDAVIESKNNIFIAEFKMGSAEEGMRQIHSKKYYEQFVSSGKKIFLLAIGFDEKERNIGSYLMEEVE